MCIRDRVNGALYTGLMTFVNAYGDVTDEQLNAMTDEEYAKYEACLLYTSILRIIRFVKDFFQLF